MRTNLIIVQTFPWAIYSKDFVNALARLLNMYGKTFKIDTKDRLAMFLAHVKAEIDVRHGRAIMRENMNYTPSRLRQVFRTMRLHPKWAEAYGRTKFHKANQKMIANIVYANRLGNRGIMSGDGWHYRGTGVLQSTGRETIKKDTETILERTGINFFDMNDEVWEQVMDTYTYGILLGMAHWYRTKMYKMDFEKTIDTINYYTDSRQKRRRIYREIKSNLRTQKWA